MGSGRVPGHGRSGRHGLRKSGVCLDPSVTGNDTTIKRARKSIDYPLVALRRTRPAAAGVACSMSAQREKNSTRSRRLLSLASTLVLGIVVVALPARAPGAATESRLALVIGNSAYETAPLRNPRNDARDMAEALRDLGFEVMLETDVDEPQMYRAVRAFGRELERRGGVGLFYYAGHGMQVRGRNYLIPIGADIRAEDEVPYQGVDAGLVLSKMDTADNRLNIVILDACRNNPFARSFRSAEQGLARMEAPSGTLLAYATAPGRLAVDGQGRNSPYTEHLLEVLRTPGLAVEQAFKRVREGVMAATDGEQIPWESSSLVGEFYFEPPVEAAAAAAPPVQPALTGQVGTQAIELSFWESIKNSTHPDDFRAYLEQFPDGIFARLARNRLSQLEGDSAGRGAGDEHEEQPQQLTLAAPAPKAQEALESRPGGGPLKIALFPFSGEGDRGVIHFPERELSNFVRGFLEDKRAVISLVEVDAAALPGRPWRGGGRRPDISFMAEAGRRLGVDGVLTYWYRAHGTISHATIKVYLVDVARERVYEAEGAWLAKDALTERVTSEFVRAANEGE